MPNSNGSTEIDKDRLYGVWKKGVDWQQKLSRKAAYKSLDIADDDVNINTSKSGIGALGVAGIALASGLGPAVLAGMMLFNFKQAPPMLPAPIQQIEKQVETWESGVDVRIKPPPDAANN